MSYEDKDALLYLADVRIDELDAENAKLRHDLEEANNQAEEVCIENAKLREQMERLVTLLRVDCDIDASWDGLRRFWSIGLTEDGCLMRDRACKAEAENAKLREQLERVQPTDCEGNVLDIADTVHMLRSEYDGDHEWEDVVTELVLTKWGGDRWIVRGSKGETWACECAKTGYDEDAYEASDDVEPFDEPTLLEVENAKLRELLKESLMDYKLYAKKYGLPPYLIDVNEHLDARLRELGIEVSGDAQ